MQELNEALKRFEPRPIEEAPPMLEEVLFKIPAASEDNTRRSGATVGWLYDGMIATPGIGYGPRPGVCWLPLPSFDRPDPRNEALRVAWEALGKFSHGSQCYWQAGGEAPCIDRTRKTICDFCLHQQAKAAILKALEGGE